MSRNGSDSKSYPVGRAKRWTLLGLAAGMLSVPGMLLIVGVVMGDDIALATGVVTGFVVAPFALLLWFAARYVRLTVSPKGVEFRDFGATAFIPWEQVISIRRTPTGGEGLILREASDAKWAIRQQRWAGMTMSGVPVYDAETQELMSGRRFLLLKPFADWMNRGDLVMEMTRHAPWLADEKSATGSSSATPCRVE